MGAQPSTVSRAVKAYRCPSGVWPRPSPPGPQAALAASSRAVRVSRTQATMLVLRASFSK